LKLLVVLVVVGWVLVVVVVSEIVGCLWWFNLLILPLVEFLHLGRLLELILLLPEFLLEMISESHLLRFLNDLVPLALGILLVFLLLPIVVLTK
jgi:hypothetical protein